MAGFVDRNKSDVPGSCTMPADRPHCSRKLPSRLDPPSNGRSLAVFMVENARELFNPSRLTQGVAGGICQNLSP